ncbi:MAG: energy-coupling factor transporter transmembrane protein EcfT [Spirochaetaceae bacterium]|jgi:biotin transport system permease protein/energy-coupling factor transport system permease protein|nr:energy-coupling factor transporter transmembrane protein EcfT [Spirochaetaceae bacterium]
MAVAFQYKKGSSLLHHTGAEIKLALLLCFSTAIMFIPQKYIILCGIFFFLCAFLCGWTAGEFIADIKGVLYYSFILYSGNFFSAIYQSSTINAFLNMLIPDAVLVVSICRMMVIIQISSLVFRTTTTIEIKDAIYSVEIKLRSAIKKIPCFRHIDERVRFGISIALTMSFISQLFECWNRLERAYKARGGKNNVMKIRTLLFALISLSFYAAAQKIKALNARALL